jgi:hypothetical protein
LLLGTSLIVLPAGAFYTLRTRLEFSPHQFLVRATAQKVGGQTREEYMAIDIDEAKVERNETGLWLGWTLATALGLLIGYLPAALLVDQMDLGLARVIVPLLAGLLIGAAQWLVLRNYLTACSDWIINLAGSWVAGYSLGLLVIDLLANRFLGTVVSFLLFGLIIAVFQWPVLRREIPQFWLWALANMVGWALGAFLSQAAIAALFGANLASPALLTVVNMAVTGLAAGLVTGLALVWIVRKPERPVAAV